MEQQHSETTDNIQKKESARQHAKLDTLMVGALAEGRSAREIEAAVEEYLEIGGLIDVGLKQQVEFDLDAFTRATGRELDEEEKDQFIRVQLQANHWTYLGSAMTHEQVLATLGGLSPAARARVEEVAPSFFLSRRRQGLDRTAQPSLEHMERLFQWRRTYERVERTSSTRLRPRRRRCPRGKLNAYPAML